MDNLAFQNDEGIPTKQPKKPLSRANSTLTPTNKSWHLTQASRPKLCRHNSVLVSKNGSPEETDYNVDGPVSLDYPFFAKKSPVKSILSDNTLWTKEFWSDRYNRLHDSSPVFQKYPLNSHGVSTIYDPQFLSSKFSYSGSLQPVSDKELKKDWWPGGWRWDGDRSNITSTQKVAAIVCALLLTLFASGNVVYILKTVEKPLESPHKGTWVDVVLISGEFRITNEPYRLFLANHTSEDFQNLSSLISHQLDSLFSLSVVSEPYHSTAVTELLPGPGQGLVVRCQILLRAATHLTATKVGLAFITGLRNHNNHVWLGNFSVDIQSIGFQASGDAVSWTGWSEWSECQHLKELGYVQVRSRNCSLRSGQYLYSTLPCLLVPHSHGNIETAPCLPSNIELTGPGQASSEVEVTTEDSNTNIRSLNEIPSPISNSTNSSQHLIKREVCECSKEQVCISLQDQPAPQCLPVLDASDPTGCGGHCTLNTQLCHKIQHNAFRCVEDSKCLEDEWQCGNKLCIPLSKRCDGHFNCYDHTDEYNCDCNLTSHFQCGNHMSCLPLNKRCDAVVDCWDATDELNCTIHCLGAEQFTCNDSQCIPNHRFCDGFPDCKDHSDEPFGCGGECKTHEWKCSNTRCIPQSKKCDGSDDCGDSSDEVQCTTAVPTE